MPTGRWACGRGRRPRDVSASRTSPRGFTFDPGHYGIAVRHAIVGSQNKPKCADVLERRHQRERRQVDLVDRDILVDHGGRRAVTSRCRCECTHANASALRTVDYRVLRMSRREASRESAEPDARFARNGGTGTGTSPRLTVRGVESAHAEAQATLYPLPSLRATPKRWEK